MSGFEGRMHPSDGLSKKTVTWVLIYSKLPVLEWNLNDLLHLLQVLVFCTGASSLVYL